MEVVRVVELEHEIAVDRGWVARGIVGPGAARQALDARGDVRAVEEGDRVAVAPGPVQHRGRGRCAPASSYCPGGPGRCRGSAAAPATRQKAGAPPAPAPRCAPGS